MQKKWKSWVYQRQLISLSKVNFTLARRISTVDIQIYWFGTKRFGHRAPVELMNHHFANNLCAFTSILMEYVEFMTLLCFNQPSIYTLSKNISFISFLLWYSVFVAASLKKPARLKTEARCYNFLTELIWFQLLFVW